MIKVNQESKDSGRLAQKSLSTRTKGFLYISILFKKFPLSCFLLLFGIVIFYTRNITIANDMGLYMNYALNIFLGEGYTAMDGSLVLFRGPVFPLMISASYWLFGPSPWSAFWVVRLFCISTPIMIYILGKEVFGKYVGFSAALLILTSYTMSYWSYRHLDIVWPFFVFLAIFLLYKGMKKESMHQVLFVIAGLSLGIGFLVKEVAVLFFPLPFMLFLYERETLGKKGFYNILKLYAVLFLCISPWIVYQTIHGEFTTPLGKAAPFFFGEATGSHGGYFELFDFLTRFLKGLGHFYHSHPNSTDVNFTIAPFFLVSIGYAIFQAIVCKDRRFGFILISIIPFLPIMQSIGNINIRIGQGLYFYSFAYLLLASFLFNISGKLVLCFGSGENDRLAKGVQGLVVFLFIIVQVFIHHNRDLSGAEFYKESFVAINPEQSGDRCVKRLYTIADIKLSKKIRDRLPKNSNILVLDYKAIHRDWKPIYFFNKGEYRVFSSPSFDSLTSDVTAHSRERVDSHFMFIDSKWSVVSPLNHFWILREDVLYDFIKKKQIEFVVHEKNSGLAPYFESHPGFKLILTLQSGFIRIYKISARLDESHFEPIVTKKARRYYRNLLIKNQKALLRLENHFFTPLLKLNKDELKALFITTN